MMPLRNKNVLFIFILHFFLLRLTDEFGCIMVYGGCKYELSLHISRLDILKLIHRIGRGTVTV